MGPELLPDTGRHLNDHLQSLYQNASASLDGNGSAVGSLGVLLDQLNKSPKCAIQKLHVLLLPFAVCNLEISGATTAMGLQSTLR